MKTEPNLTDPAHAKPSDDTPRVRGRGGQANIKPSAYRAMDGEAISEGLRRPDEIYFYTPAEYTGNVPPDQEKAREELEDICSVLRVVLRRKYPDVFREYFNKILSIAQATFTPGGFRPQPRADLDRIRGEVAQLMGGKIKADYVRRMLIATVIATFVVISGTIMVHLIARELSNRGAIATIEPPRTGADQKRGIPNLVRWDEGYTIGHMGVLLTAAMWGLFLAACFRNFEPTFEKLKSSDADLMPPWSRLLVFGIVILGIAIILHRRLVVVAFGDSFSTAEINEDLGTALIIGLLLGIAERALPQRLERWSLGLVTKIDKGADAT